MLGGRKGGTRVQLGVVLTGTGVHGAAGIGVLEELAAAHPTVKVGKLNTDENLKLAMARKIDAIPALLLFRNGQEVSRSVGYKPAAELEAWLRENGAI